MKKLVLAMVLALATAGCTHEGAPSSKAPAAVSQQRGPDAGMPPEVRYAGEK